MTKQEAAVIETFTGKTMLTGNDVGIVYEYAEKLLGFKINTLDLLIHEKELKEKSKPDFLDICHSLYSEDERNEMICEDFCKYRDDEKAGNKTCCEWRRKGLVCPLEFYK